MVKMHSMKKTAAERKAEDKVGEGTISPHEYAEPEGIEIHVHHDHLKKLGLDGPLPHGTKVSFGGEGEVTGSESSESYGKPGEVRHRMVLRLHKAGVEPEESDDGNAKRDELRRQIEVEHGKSEQKRSEREAERTAKREGKEKTKADAEEVY